MNTRILPRNPKYECSPPQGLSEQRRGSAVFSDMLIVPDPPRGRPVGGGGTYHNRGYGGISPQNSVSEEFNFHGKSSGNSARCRHVLK